MHEPAASKGFDSQLARLQVHPTVENSAVNITPEGLQAMEKDPVYRKQVLALIERDLGSSYAPRSCSVSITIGADLEEYRADSWPVGNDSEFHFRSANSYWKRTRGSASKDSIEAFQQRLARQRAQETQRIERLRIAQNNQYRQCAAIYEAHMCEPKQPTERSLMEG